MKQKLVTWIGVGEEERNDQLGSSCSTLCTSGGQVRQQSYVSRRLIRSDTGGGDGKADTNSGRKWGPHDAFNWLCTGHRAEIIVPQQLPPTTACVAANLPAPHYPFCSSNPRVRHQRAENNYLFFFPLQSKSYSANLTP